MFNLVPTDPDEYKIYADWLEDQGVILTAAIRQGILPFDSERGIAKGSGVGMMFPTTRCYGFGVASMAGCGFGAELGDGGGYENRTLGIGRGNWNGDDNEDD